MKKWKNRDLLIAVVAWGTILLSAEALVYYIRWFVPLLGGRHSFVAPPVKIPQLWFFVKIANNAIFLWVGVLLLRLYRKYRRTGFFEKDSLRLLNDVIIACLSLAFLVFVQTICEHGDELHTEWWTSLWAISNCLWRFFTHDIVFREPLMIYLLLAAILWGIRQFVTQALTIKKENESFI